MRTIYNTNVYIYIYRQYLRHVNTSPSWFWSELDVSEQDLQSSLGQDYVEQMDALAAGNQNLRILYKEVAESNTSGWTLRAFLFF